MNIKFTKMHALGNDYIIINGWEYSNLLDIAPQLSIKMSNRHFGVGGDGVIFALPSDKADAMMRIFNADGSEAEMCGNGIRQVAKYIYDNRIVHKTTIAVDTLAGVKIIELETDDDDMMSKARVNMGEPIFTPFDVPVNTVFQDGKNFPRVSCDVSKYIDSPTPKTMHFDFTVLSMGNPHAITFIDDVDDFPVERFGPDVENNAELFPARTNVEFVEVLSRSEIKMRVWERGSGETLACGTGASASVVASALNGFTDRKVTVHLLGGPLYIEWADDNTVYMSGGAEVAFEGTYQFTL